jgi:hypothetical protein
LPVDADQVSCAYCGHAVAVSLALRSAVRAAGHGADALQRELPSLLERAPTAQLLLRIRLSAALMLGAWPVAFALAAVRIGAALTAAQLLLTILFAWALLLGGFLLAQLLLLDRHALRLLATRFGAARAARPDGPPRCRGCGGPLLVSVNAMLARCVFCSRENLLGVSLRRARSQEAEAESLERALAQQRTKRTRALGLLLGALFLLAVSGAALAQSFDAG